MSYQEYCDLCSESYDDDNLTACKDCHRWFCYQCGSCGDGLCLRCLQARSRAAETHQPKRRMLFLDGMGCHPDGFKVNFMRGLGYEVFCPLLPDLDFDGSLTIAEDALRSFQPDVVVGYSRGGAIAMLLRDQPIPRLLIAPALAWVPEGRKSSGRIIILHSDQDDALPVESSRQFLERCGRDPATLRVVGSDHTMIDEQALAALQQALSELTGLAHSSVPPKEHP